MASVRKLACSISLLYKSGLRAETLQGTDFTLEQGVARVRLGFNLSGNLNPWNRNLLCYSEALEFIDNYRDLAEIRIRDKQLSEAVKQVPDGYYWHLDIKCRNDIDLRYIGRPRVQNDTVLFIVERLAEGTSSSENAGNTSGSNAPPRAM